MCSRTLRTTPPVRQNEVGDSSFDHLVGHLTQIIDGHDFDGQSEVSVRGIRASLAEPEVVLLRLRTKDQDHGDRKHHIRHHHDRRKDP
jgi:hypothetical protein